MNVAEALRVATERLSESSDTARLDAELLMAHALGVSRSEMLLRRMGDAEPEEFAEVVARRAAHEPVAHVVGSQEFFGRKFTVSPAVLIPRSDSETLIFAALELVPNAKRVLDLGTGSGCLLLTMIAELSGAEGVGIDASHAAIDIAVDNALDLEALSEIAFETPWSFHVKDWSEPSWAENLGKFDLILANPPYVETTADLHASVREFEPEQALFAGEDGLDDYKAIIPQLRALMTKDGIAILEIGHAQAKSVSEIAANHGFSVEIRQDLGGRDRVAILT